MKPAAAKTLMDRLGITGSAAVWAAEQNRGAKAAWAACPRPEWLVTVATRLAVERLVVVRAAARAVQIALPAARRDAVAQRAWDVAVRWTNGQATPAECRAARSVAAHAAGQRLPREPRIAGVLDAVSALADACDAEATLENWIAAGHAVEAVRRAAATLDRTLLGCAADVVRDEIRWETIGPLVNRVLRTPIRSGIRETDLAFADEDTPVVRRGRRV